VELGLALLPVGLARLLLVERVQVGVAAVRVHAVGGYDAALPYTALMQRQRPFSFFEPSAE
jgi:hypothetical protein